MYCDDRLFIGFLFDFATSSQEVLKTVDTRIKQSNNPTIHISIHHPSISYPACAYPPETGVHQPSRNRRFIAPPIENPSGKKEWPRAIQGTPGYSNTPYPSVFPRFFSSTMTKPRTLLRPCSLPSHSNKIDRKGKKKGGNSVRGIRS
jgi:hypothetical protein